MHFFHLFFLSFWCYLFPLQALVDSPSSGKYAQIWNQIHKFNSRLQYSYFLVYFFLFLFLFSFSFFISVHLLFFHVTIHYCYMKLYCPWTRFGCPIFTLFAAASLLFRLNEPVSHLITKIMKADIFIIIKVICIRIIEMFVKQITLLVILALTNFRDIHKMTKFLLSYI